MLHFGHMYAFCSGNETPSVESTAILVSKAGMWLEFIDVIEDRPVLVVSYDERAVEVVSEELRPSNLGFLG